MFFPFLYVFVYCILIWLWILLCYCIMVWIFTDWLYEILNPRLEDMLITAIYLWYLPGTFLVVLQVRVGYRFYSLHTHTLHAYFMSGILKPRIWKSIELEGFSDTGMDVLPTLVFMRISARVYSLIVYS